MAYIDLSDEDKAAIQAMATVARALAGELARVLEKIEAVVAYYTGNVETMLGKLAASDLIPNTSGLTGAQDMTKSELVNLVSYFITASARPDNSSGSYNTKYHRALYAKACGPENLIR